MVLLEVLAVLVVALVGKMLVAQEHLGKEMMAVLLHLLVNMQPAVAVGRGLLEQLQQL
jgi:hypothetical protein